MGWEGVRHRCFAASVSRCPLVTFPEVDDWLCGSTAGSVWLGRNCMAFPHGVTLDSRV